MLLNLTNHHSPQWPEAQKKEAKEQFGSISDLPFPSIEPQWDEEKVQELAEDYRKKCIDVLKVSENQKNAVHLMGEHTFCFALIRLLQEDNITCIASTTNRISKENNSGERKVQFRFVQFRAYPKL